MHRPLRTASAEPATLTSAAAYQGAVTTMKYPPNRPLACPYRVFRASSCSSLSTATAPCAKVVA